MDKLIAGARKLGLELKPGQIERFRTYYDELIKWNRRVNLTAITGYEQVQLSHFLDALTVISAWPVSSDGRVIDVGTGAGIPGVPLKIARPDIKLVLLDSIHKKAAFLNHLIARLGLDDVQILTGRAEEVAHRTEYRERFDVVLARGVAPLPALVELMLPFCAVGGRAIAQKKGDITVEVNNAAPAISELGGRLKEVRRITLEEFSDDRCLVIIEKVGPTPSRYPRRAGVPGKRPIMVRPAKRGG